MNKPYSETSPRTSPGTSPWNLAHERAFTLIELLVTCSIIAVLAALGGSVYSSASQRAAMVRETSAAKQLMAAYHLYSADHNGELIPGIDATASAMTMPDGTEVSATEVSRYPYRLAPYFSYKFEGVTLVNKNKYQIKTDGVFPNAIYGYSLCPAMGMNFTKVGGDRQLGGFQNTEDLVTREGQAPGSVVIFASAAYKVGDTKIDGYMSIYPPYGKEGGSTNWGGSATSWNKNSAPASYGNIDARYNGKAVCAFMDGSVKTLSIKELNDMRLWSRNAIEEDNSQYVLPATVSHGRL